MAFGAHDHAATACAVAVFDAADAINNARCRKVWRGDDFHQFVNGRLRIGQHVQTSVHHFVQVVGRNIGRHAHGNARGAVDQQVRNAAGQDQRFFFGAIVVGAEIDGFFVDVAQHFVRDFGQTDFRVTHGRCVVTIDRAEVTLAVHQHVTQRKVLRHAHNRVVDRAVAVRVVFTDHVTDDTG